MTYDLRALSFCDIRDLVFYMPLSDDYISELRALQVKGTDKPGAVICFVKALSDEMYQQPGELCRFPIIYLTYRTIPEAKAYCRRISRLIRIADNEDILYEGITQDLLMGTEKYERNDMVFLCKLINLENQGPYRVFLLKTKNNSRSRLEDIRQMLRALYKIVLSVIWKDVLICIVSGSLAERDQLNVIYETVNREMGANCRISASGLKESLTELHHGLQEALRTYDMIDVVNESSDKVLSYEELGIFRVLFELNDSRVFDDYVKKVFSPLWEYDKKNNSSLFQTLECYFDNEADIKRTAEALFIHMNTLRYRLNQIEMIMNRDLKNIYDITEIETAFKVRTMSEVILD